MNTICMYNKSGTFSERIYNLRYHNSGQYSQRACGSNDYRRPYNSSMCIRRSHNNYGFTLLEVTLSIIIVGLGVASLMLLMASETKVNAIGNTMSTATFLANQMRAMTDQVPFDGLTAYNGVSYNGVDAQGNPIPGMEAYTEQINVQPVDPVSLTIYIGTDPKAVIMTVIILYNHKQITKISWLREKA